MKRKIDDLCERSMEMESQRLSIRLKLEAPANTSQQYKEKARFDLQSHDHSKHIFGGNGTPSAVQSGHEKLKDMVATIHPFLRLPPELRRDIYRYCLIKDCIIINELPAIGASEVNTTGKKNTPKDNTTSVLMTSKKIYTEALEVLYGENRFQFNLTRPSHSSRSREPRSDRYENCFSCFSEANQRRVKHLSLILCVHGLYEVEGTIKDVHYWTSMLARLVNLKVIVSTEYFIFNLKLRYSKRPLDPDSAKVGYERLLSTFLASWPGELRPWFDLLAQGTNPCLKIMVHNGGGPETQAVIEEALDGRHKNVKLYDTIKSKQDWENVERGLR